MSLSDKELQNIGDQVARGVVKFAGFTYPPKYAPSTSTSPVSVLILACSVRSLNWGRLNQIRENLAGE